MEFDECCICYEEKNSFKVKKLSKFKKINNPIKLSANESALGPSPKAMKAYNEISKNFKRYPDSDGNLLKEILCWDTKVSNYQKQFCAELFQVLQNLFY